eukprot:974972-Rhodomonas_salina.1
MSGTELAYGSMCLVLRRAISVLSFALATRCPVLRFRMVLALGQVPLSRRAPSSHVIRVSLVRTALCACYAMSGTDQGYAATRAVAAITSRA